MQKGFGGLAARSMLRATSERIGESLSCGVWKRAPFGAQTAAVLTPTAVEVWQRDVQMLSDVNCEAAECRTQKCTINRAVTHAAARGATHVSDRANVDGQDTLVWISLVHRSPPAAHNPFKFSHLISAFLRSSRLLRPSWIHFRFAFSSVGFSTCPTLLLVLVPVPFFVCARVTRTQDPASVTTKCCSGRLEKIQLVVLSPNFLRHRMDAGDTVEVTVYARGIFGAPVFTVPRGPPLLVQGTPRAGLAACRSPQWPWRWRVAISRFMQRYWVFCGITSWRKRGCA